MKALKQFKRQDFLWYVGILIFLLFVYFLLYKILMPRILSFGCFDDCFNLMGGYFILNGRHLYSEIFYNHQPFAAFLSFVIQKLRHPENIYELVRVHRQFLLIFSFIMNFILCIRFRWAAFGFVIFYEFTKFYLFGDRFLAESFIVYPVVYLVGVIFYKVTHKKLYLLDYILSAIFTWFIIFMREPYIPLAIFLFSLIVISRPFSNEKKLSIGILLIISLVTCMQFSLNDYFFNVITINQMTVLHSETSSIFSNPKNILQIIFYPVFILFTGKWNVFRELMIGVDSIFLLLIFLLYRFKLLSKFLLVILFSILALANVRATDPGVVFYEGFHMLVWYSTFLFSTFFLIATIFKKNKRLSYILFGTMFGMLGFLIVSGKTYISERVDLQTELLTNYGKELQVGEVVKKLSYAGDTLFLDGFDDLIYWQANRLSPYQYSWYTSFMHSIPLYSKAKQTMFSKTPPDFYYGSCIKNIPYWDMPGNTKTNYIRLYDEDKPSCLYIHKNKFTEISQEQWKKAEEFGYSLRK